MPSVHLIARCGGAPVKRAWFYVKQGDAITLLRSDGDGQLVASSAEPAGDAPPKIATFVKPFTFEVPASIQIAYSRGGLIIPDALLRAAPAAFATVELAMAPENAEPVAVAVAPNDLNTVRAVPTISLDVPPLPVTFEEPRALEVWPLLASPFPDGYATSGLAQGAALWPADGARPVRDGASAPSPLEADCPRDAGLRVRGKVSNHAAKVNLYLVDAKGARLKFRLAADATANQAVDVASLDVKGETSRFEATLFADDPARFFGLAHLVAVTEGGGPDGLGDVVGELLGVQLGLCDDGMQSDDGDAPGPCVGRAHEKNVIDFVVTAVHGPGPDQKLDKHSHDPAIKAAIDAARHAAEAALAPHGRARRMVCFDIRASRRRRPPGAGVDTNPVVLPEMPMWMAELQLVGWRRDEGELFLQLRGEGLGAAKRPLTIEADFALELGWRGPDADVPGPERRPGVPRNEFADVTMTFSGSFRGPKKEVGADGAGGDDDDAPPPAKVEAHFDAGSVLSTTVDIDEDDGTLRVEEDGSNSLQPDFPWAAAPFPSDKRRAPKVWLAERSRVWGVWGWKGDGPVVPALVFEWQPAVVTIGRNRQATEIMLGGNGRLRVGKLAIAGTPVTRAPAAEPGAADGAEGEGAGAEASAATAALLELPAFRVKGNNPEDPRALDELLTAAVSDVMAANRTSGSASMLKAAAWKRLSEMLMFHESGGHHFDTSVQRAVFRERIPYQCHGIQAGMPKFGAPAGYGLGQHDPPRSLQDMWSFYEHIRKGVEMLIVTEFGRSSYSYLNGLHAIDPANVVDRAIFVREVVRSYNGGHEMVYEDGKWKMKPFIPARPPHHAKPMPEDRMPYANRVLGTNVRYGRDPEATDAQEVAGQLRPLL